MNEHYIVARKYLFVNSCDLNICVISVYLKIRFFEIYIEFVDDFKFGMIISNLQKCRKVTNDKSYVSHQRHNQRSTSFVYMPVISSVIFNLFIVWA